MPSSEQHQIVLINGPIHYDILVTVEIVQRDMPWLATSGIALDHPDVRWVVFGWGGHDFYTTIGTYADVSLRAIWRGLTGDTAVMRVSVAGNLSERWAQVALNDEQIQNLTIALNDSFQNGVNSQPLAHAGFSEFDRFFHASGRFHIFNTCNVWVGKMLRQAGLKFGRWTPTPFAVTLAHRRFLTP